MTEREKTLIAGCVNGEKAAWDAFVREFSPLVYHTIKKTFNLYHSDPISNSVEDLYQEVFVSLLRDDCKKLRQFRGDRGCTLASWLRVVAARETIDFLRKRRLPSVEIPDGLARNDPDLSESLIDEEQERLLNQAIQTLPPRDRILIDLVYRQSLPPEEIAAILKISVNAVYTQKSRILARLREALKTEL
jgi:RNA polymerase sigma factor (sigma-70 family)